MPVTLETLWRNLGQRFRTGLWSKFSLLMLVYHVAIWGVFIGFYRSCTPDISDDHLGLYKQIAAILIHIAMFELANHVTRSLKELSFATALLLSPGWLIGILFFGATIPSFLAPISWWLVTSFFVSYTFGFVGVFLLTLALRFSYRLNRCDPAYPGILHAPRSQKLIITGRILSHLFAWTCVSLWVFSLNWHLEMFMLPVVFAVFEFSSWFNPRFNVLLAVAAVIQSTTICTLVAVVFVQSPSFFNPFQAMTLASLSYPGWIFLLLLLSYDRSEKSISATEKAWLDANRGDDRSGRTPGTHHPATEYGP